MIENIQLLTGISRMRATARVPAGSFTMRIQMFVFCLLLVEMSSSGGLTLAQLLPPDLSANITAIVNHTDWYQGNLSASNEEHHYFFTVSPTATTMTDALQITAELRGTGALWEAIRVSVYQRQPHPDLLWTWQRISSTARSESTVWSVASVSCPAEQTANSTEFLLRVRGSAAGAFQLRLFTQPVLISAPDTLQSFWGPACRSSRHASADPTHLVLAVPSLLEPEQPMRFFVFYTGEEDCEPAPVLSVLLSQRNTTCPSTFTAFERSNITLNPSGGMLVQWTGIDPFDPLRPGKIHVTVLPSGIKAAGCCPPAPRYRFSAGLAAAHQPHATGSVQDCTAPACELQMGGSTVTATGSATGAVGGADSNHGRGALSFYFTLFWVYFTLLCARI